MARAVDPFEADMLAAMPKLRACACRLTRAADRADDLVQDTMVRALRARDQFQAGTNMGAWLCFIARNHFLSEARRAWRSVHMAEGQAEAVPTPASAHHAAEVREVLTALQYLPAEQASALLAIALGDDDYDGVAEEFGVPTGTIKSRVSRARSALHAFFQTGSTQ